MTLDGATQLTASIVKVAALPFCYPNHIGTAVVLRLDLFVLVFLKRIKA